MREGITMETKQEKRAFHYAWVIFAVCFLSVLTSLGFCSSPKSLFVAAVTEDLSIPRSLFSIGDSCRYITTAVVNLFFGRLVVRFGPRKLFAAGFVCLTASSLVAAAAQGVWTFYLSSVLLGLGLAWSTTSLAGVVVERWFTSSKGTIMGLILAANGLGGAISSQILARLIYGSADGWRSAYLFVAAVLAVVGVVLVLLMRNDPAEIGARPLGDGGTVKRKSRGRDWTGIEAHEAFRKPYFYVCALCVFLTGMILQSASGVASPHMKDQGISTEVIANAMSIGSLILMVSKMSTGACFDRFGLRVTMLFCSVCSVAAMVLLANVNSAAMAMVYRLLMAFGLPLETIMLPLIAKECFGQRSYAFLMGLMVSFNTLGYALGAPLMNYAYDKTGTYTGALWVVAGMMVVVAVVMQLVITAAHRERKRIEAA